MMLPTIEIDGVPLNDPMGRWWVSDESGEPVTGAPRRSSVETPGHHGNRPAPSVMSAGAYRLVVTIEAGTYGELHQSVADVKRALAGKTITRHPDGLTSQNSTTATFQVAGALEPVREQHTRGWFADIEADLEIPLGRWLSVLEETTYITAPGTVTVPALFGGSAPMSPIITVAGNGSATNARVTDVESGNWIGLVGYVPPGAMVAVDTDPDALTATSGDTDYSSLIRLGPRPFYLSPSAQIAVTQAGTFNQVTLKARRAFS